MLSLALIPLLVILALGTANGQAHTPQKGKVCKGDFIVAQSEPCPKALEVFVQPKICLSSCDIRVEVHIEPHPKNHWWLIELDGPQYQSGMNQLNGEKSAKTQAPVQFKQLPLGHYTLKVILYRDLAQKSEAARFTIAFEIGVDEL